MTNKKDRVKGETLHLLSYSVIKIAQDSQINMSLSSVKRLKYLIFN